MGHGAARKTKDKLKRFEVAIHGGYGYVREYHVERLIREAKVIRIYESTSEIQKMVISRSSLRKTVLFGFVNCVSDCPV